MTTVSNKHATRKRDLFNPANCSIILELYMNWTIPHEEVHFECYKRYGMWETIFIVLLLTIIAFGTTLGNSLVILAVALAKKLQTSSNLLIVSLAASDLLVGCVVVPFAIIGQIHTIWPLNQVTCDIFIVFDVLLCTSSILNLTAISVDRYLVITRPFQYAIKRTPCRMVLMVAFVWLISALISIPPIIGWHRVVRPGECGYPTDLGYQIYATIGAFYLPLVVMLVLYGRIFKLARQMATADAKQKITSFSTAWKESLDVPVDLVIMQKDAERLEQELNGIELNLNELNSGLATRNMLNKKLSIQSSTTIELRNRVKQKSNSDTKAIKTLGFIMGGFTLCWLPFFIIQLIIPIVEVARNEKLQPPRNLMEVFLWLGYINSFLNPLIYAKFNRDFRTPFKEILLGHWQSINHRLRSESFAEQHGLNIQAYRRQSSCSMGRLNRRKSLECTNLPHRQIQQQPTAANGFNHVKTSD